MKLATTLAPPATSRSRTLRSPRNPATPRGSVSNPRSRAMRAGRSQRFDDRSSSLLDETRRRMKGNMRAIAALLRLHPVGFEAAYTEAMLAEMESHLQSMALHYRSRCRGGEFEHIDLAVFLRTAARLLNSPPQFSLDGGWTVENNGALVWDDAPAAEIPGDLESIITSLPDRVQEPARRAVYACAVIAPAWLFHWRRPSTIARNDGDVSLRVRTEGALVVQLVFSERGPGLPTFFEPSTQAELASAITSVLDRLSECQGSGEASPAVRFEVGFAPTHNGASQSARVLGHAA